MQSLLARSSRLGACAPLARLCASGLSKPPVAVPAHIRQRRPRTVAVEARSGGYGYSSAPDLLDRGIAAATYLLPLIAVFPYGKYLFYQYPAIQQAMSPLMPLIQLYYSVPLASLVVFLGVYAGIVTNNFFSRYVRFNAMQAILLDIALIVPRLVQQFMGQPNTEAMLQFSIQFQNAVWLAIAGSVAYSVFMCVTGQTARIPLVSDAVDQQVR